MDWFRVLICQCSHSSAWTSLWTIRFLPIREFVSFSLLWLDWLQKLVTLRMLSYWMENEWSGLSSFNNLLLFLSFSFLASNMFTAIKISWWFLFVFIIFRSCFAAQSLGQEEVLYSRGILFLLYLTAFRIFILGFWNVVCLNLNVLSLPYFYGGTKNLRIWSILILGFFSLFGWLQVLLSKIMSLT